MQTQYKGSVTVFFSLTFLLVISLILSLVEVIHFTEVKENMPTVSKIGTESLFGDFNRILWDDYGILAVDAGYGKGAINIPKAEERIGEYVIDNINPQPVRFGFLDYSSNFTRAYPAEISISEYGLITDDGGAAFIKQAAKQALYGIPETFLTDWNNTVGQIQDDSNNAQSMEELLEQGSSAGIESAMENAEENVMEGTEEEGMESIPSDVPPLENPVDIALSWRSQSVLSLVLKDPQSVSTLSVADRELLSRRSINSGTLNEATSVSPTDKILCALYMREKFSSYRMDRGHGGLKYQWEYVLNGESSDDKNLRATVETLLGLREIQNMASIVMDGAKVAQCLALATAICFAVPFLIEPVKWGIMAAWAYLESVLDVRLLLNGGKVAVVKTPLEWTSNIFMFASYLDPGVMAKSSEFGMAYEDYLMVLSTILSQKNMGLRSLDILEIALNGESDYMYCRMDNFIFKANVDYTYNANPLFASVVPLLAGKLGTYEFKHREGLSYIT